MRRRRRYGEGPPLLSCEPSPPMSLLRSLLVHVDTTDRGAVRLQVAAELAARHQASVHALLADPRGLGDTPTTYAASAIAAQALQDAEIERRAGARAVFDQLFEEGPRARWSELGAEPPAWALAREAACADLVLLGQRDRTQAADSGLPADFVEQVVIDGATPALVLPPHGLPAVPAGVAVVAWRPSAESVRALRGALPLLQLASRVLVVSWGEEPVPSLGHLDVAGYLSSHGIEAQVQRERHVPRDVGTALLQVCRDHAAGLLVMGCYGHSRARERWLGGASRSVLRHMDIPVLMAH